jgi:hypothetical protein
MKRILLGLFTITALSFASVEANAQAFTTDADTVYLTYSGSFGMDAHNDITAGANPVSLKWKVVSENFSTDVTWTDGNSINVCDNYNCYTNAGNALLNSTEYTSPTPYAANQTDVFKASFQLPTANHGTHYVTIRLTDITSGDFKNITFVTNKWQTSTGTVSKNSDDIVLFPNPVRDEVNVVFNDLNVKNIAVYNVIGKTMVVYRTTGSSAKMDLSKFPAGVYFLRMSDAKGDVVATKRFTKQ